MSVNQSGVRPVADIKRVRYDVCVCVLSVLYVLVFSIYNVRRLHKSNCSALVGIHFTTN